MAALGQAFMAYRTVKPKAFGNAKQSSEADFNLSNE
jgi:hypothetical protein